MVNQSIDKKNINYTGIVEFSTVDLQGSILHATINIKGNAEMKRLKIEISDIYDFDYQNTYYKGFGGSIREAGKWLAFTVGNNLAWSDQYFDVINNYEVYLEFEYDLE